MNEVLFKILEKLAAKPELVAYVELTKVVGKMPYNEGRVDYYTIKLCCEGHGAIVTLHNNAKLDFSLTDEERERFDKCILAINKACEKFGYELLLDFLHIETDSNSTTNK